MKTLKIALFLVIASALTLSYALTCMDLRGCYGGGACLGGGDVTLCKMKCAAGGTVTCETAEFY